MKKISTYKLITVVLGITLMVFLCACSNHAPKTMSGDSNSPLRVAISPYQDVAMLVNEKSLGLEEKYRTKLDLVTMPWEDILPALASAGQTVDVGFVGLSDYLIKTENLNGLGDDPILFIYPAYVFNGGGFISFNPDVPNIDAEKLKDPATIKKFLGFRIGVQKNSVPQMLFFMLAHKVGVKPSKLEITDITFNDGLLAAENGNLDITYAGLTQRTEALKRHGRVVLTLETAGIADITGFACKASVYKQRKKDIDSLIKMWFDCANYVLSDLDHHTNVTLTYLKNNASTKYTLKEYKNALTQEYFPRSINEAQKKLISGTGEFSIKRMSDITNQYLIDNGIAKSPRPAPKIISVDQ